MSSAMSQTATGLLHKFKGFPVKSKRRLASSINLSLDSAKRIAGRKHNNQEK